MITIFQEISFDNVLYAVKHSVSTKNPYFVNAGILFAVKTSVKTLYVSWEDVENDQCQKQ